MEATCARAVELGLPSVAFTEHVDLTRWALPAATRAAMHQQAALIGPDGRFDPPPLDVEGYLAALERCRARFPALRIRSGVELGEPHWFTRECHELLAGGAFDRVLASLHSVPAEGERWIVDDLAAEHAPPGMTAHDVVRAYLAEVLAMIRGFDQFTVLAHIDYPARGWPGRHGAFPIRAFEEEFRAALSALAASGRALEVNTKRPGEPEIIAWWRDVGGQAVSFGSDAHEPAHLARGFARASAMVEAHGFRPARDAGEVWQR